MLDKWLREDEDEVKHSMGVIVWVVAALAVGLGMAACVLIWFASGRLL